MDMLEIQDLLRRISVQDAALKEEIARGLRSRDAAPGAVRFLRGLLASPHEDRRDAAAQAMREMGRPGVEALLDAARNEPFPAGRLAAVEWLADSGLQGCFVTGTPYDRLDIDPLPTLWDCLSDRVAGVRAAALDGLLGLGPRDPRLLERAPSLSRDSDPRIRAKAALLIGREEKVSAPLEETLLELLQDSDPQPRFEAAFALAGRGVEIERVYSSLRTGLDFPDERIRTASARYLRFYSSRALDLALPLAKRLEDEDPQVARQALETLGGFGAAAAAAAPAVDALFRKRDLIWECATTLSGMGPAGIRVLAKRLDDPEEEIRYQVLRAVGDRGSEARGAMGGILRCLDDRVARIRFRAVQALLKLDPLQTTTVISRIREASEFDRSHLAWYLAEIGEPAVDVFRKLAADADPALRDLSSKGQARLAELSRETGTGPS